MIACGEQGCEGQPQHVKALNGISGKINEPFQGCPLKNGSEGFAHDYIISWVQSDLSGVNGHMFIYVGATIMLV